MYARTSTGTVLLIGPDRFYVIVFGTGFGGAVPWKGERDNVEPECPGYYKQARGASSKALTGGTSTSPERRGKRRHDRRCSANVVQI